MKLEILKENKTTKAKPGTIMQMRMEVLYILEMI
jgi:hypothetical protein